MKFHSLVAVALLLLAFDSGAALLRSDLPVAAPQAEATHVYQNGELVLKIRDTAGGEIVRAGLDYFFHDEHIATANELPAGPVEAIQAREPVAAAQAAAAQLPEPFSLGLLGAGLVLLGWTRRQGSWFERLKQHEVFPWPGLSWLD